MGGATTVAGIKGKTTLETSGKVEQSQSGAGAATAGGPNQADLENIIFTFKVNKKFYFTKSLKEVDQFCKEFS
jgi:hypothetical protein